MAPDIQRKYAYQADFTFNHGYAASGSALIDELTPPEIKRDIVSRQNRKLGQIKLAGPATYGDLTLRIALKVGADAEATANQIFVQNLEEVSKFDADTVDVIVTMNNTHNALVSSSWTQSYLNCKIISVKLDSISRKDDGDFLHVELILSPQLVTNPSYIG